MTAKQAAVGANSQPALRDTREKSAIPAYENQPAANAQHIDRSRQRQAEAGRDRSVLHSGFDESVGDKTHLTSVEI